ncbi:hypothetical protein F4779DRAFT_616820 [Xylariaceae sp. FL0662B]|nr:hypothetical protein F4779DRAFT_616820 [Xylariaceae sp. FL0662B]
MESTPASKLSTAAAAACELLSTSFLGRVTVPDDPQYQRERDQPWSSNCRLAASIFVQPRDGPDVAEALRLVRKAGSRFVVRCAGHNSNPGFSSVDRSGVVIDLRDLKTLELGDDGILRTGAGNTWGDVYAFLEDRGLTAIGGRQRDVGVSGFLLGGADNVKNYEVVLSDSSIINASANENAELYRSPKGGGSNFGIVTRFDLQTYPISTQYTINTYDPSGFGEVLRATAKAQAAMETDPKIGMFTFVNSTYVAVGLLYADSEAQRPKAFDTFFNLRSLITSAVPTTKGTIKSLVDAINLLGPVTRQDNINSWHFSLAPD